jgi:EAL domain-containing protein (putative c-di-GMP-specific phosphodiesterase class I)
LVAEGIESAEQLEFVRHAHERVEMLKGIHAVQGYALGYPVKGQLLDALSDVAEANSRLDKVAG